MAWGPPVVAGLVGSLDAVGLGTSMCTSTEGYVNRQQTSFLHRKFSLLLADPDENFFCFLESLFHLPLKFCSISSLATSGKTGGTNVHVEWFYQNTLMECLKCMKLNLECCLFVGMYTLYLRQSHGFRCWTILSCVVAMV